MSTRLIMVDCDPENQARSSKEGGIDGYGVEWVFVEVVGVRLSSRATPKSRILMNGKNMLPYQTLTPGTGKAVMSATRINCPRREQPILLCPVVCLKD